jgi:stage II sporulation protein D
MPKTFSLEAIKAQAVCARTYAIKQLNNEKQTYEAYDACIDDSTYYQVYNINKKTKKSIKAVDETDGMIITYNGIPIDAYYFSTSCGMTADGEVLSSACAYLKSRTVSAKVVNASTDSEKEEIILEKDLPYYKWSLEISEDDICNNIEKYTDASATNIDDVIVEDAEESGIVTKIRIIADEKEIEVCGQQNIRNILCSYGTEITLNDGSTRTDFSVLPSAFINIEKENTDNGVFFKINGGGFGHGCGMSQNGANEMAKIGKSFEEILNAFYSDIDIINFSEV